MRYPGTARDAVAGIDVTVAAGEIFGLLGPNSAGKLEPIYSLCQSRCHLHRFQATPRLLKSSWP